MTQSELKSILNQLISSWENEVIEFKQASADHSTSDIGKYFSALSNEANLRNIEKAWLVFGVHNKTRAIVGTDYRPEPERLHSLKMQMSQGTEPTITFREIYELQDECGRVVLFEIPAAPKGMPISWNGHYYARSGKSLTALSMDKIDDIRKQTQTTDWTAQPVPSATQDHLDSTAIQKARESFAKKYANRFTQSDVMDWPLATFLDRAKLTQDGRITRTALALVGQT